MAKKIIVDPARLESAASIIEAQVNDYEQIYKSLFDKVEGMGAAWQGADNKAFTEQAEGFREDFKKMQDLMKDYSTFLKKSATTYREAQNEIATAARSLAN